MSGASQGGGQAGPKLGTTDLGLESAVKPPRVDSTWLLLRRIRAESGTRGLFAGRCLSVHMFMFYEHPCSYV